MFSEFLAAHPRFAALRRGLPYPAGEDREAWARANLQAACLHDAREARRVAYPLLTATQFMGFVRTGDRRVFEAPYFERRQRLIRMAVGECLAWDGSFLDEVVDGLWLLSEETGWVVSAHNVDSHPGSPKPAERPLPDKENPVIDLFAAQTAATVTLCCHLLAEKLDGVTPLIRRRVGAEVAERVLNPFFRRDDFWWMGMIRRDVNNWTPWILSNILICLMYWEADGARLQEGLVRVMEMLERYLATIPEDGGCDEGAAYWNMAGAALLDCLELIHYATSGEADFYRHPKVRAIANFPVAAHIEGPYFWNFADCDAMPNLDGERLYRFGCRVENGPLKKLGARLMARDRDPWPKDTPQMSRALDRLFAETPWAEAERPEDGVTILPDLEVWACRKGRHYAAIKGGHNGENHNHNDVGSFLFYIGGRPAVVDAGNMVYTAKTFSDRRYTLWNTRSRNHNLPLIAENEQSPGGGFRAETVKMDETGAEMELKKAYPESCGIKTFKRRAFMEEAFHLKDTILLKRPEAVEWVFLLRDEPRLAPGECLAGELRMTFPASLAPTVEAYPVEDARMARSFPGTLWRLTLAAGPGAAHEAEFTFGGIPK
jgi:hypothetical protein